MAGLSQHLFTLGRANLERQLAHPTVRGIATGDLDPARFRAWLVQDYLFLLDYVRLFALTAARAPDTTPWAAWSTWPTPPFMRSCRCTAPTPLSSALPRPTWTRPRSRPCVRPTPTSCSAPPRPPSSSRCWPRCCLACGATPSLADPGRGRSADRPRYRRWIETYADLEFAGLAAWCAALLTARPTGCRRPARLRARCFWLTSLRHELAFWDARG